MKTCNICKETKSFEHYTKNKAYKDGLDGMCKECKRKKKELFYHSLRGVIVTIYDSQKLSCKTRKHPQPSYTLEELYKYLSTSKLFIDLYNQYVENNYDKYLKPSLDRIDDTKSYSFDNITIVTFKENEQKLKEQMKKGEGIAAWQCKPINQYSLNGEYIKTFVSAFDAARSLDIERRNIQAACKNRRKSAGGFIWKFAEESSETIS